MLENIISEFLKKRKPIHRPLIEVGVFSAEEDKTATSCNVLRMTAPDGKLRKTDVANRETIFRIIESIPSPKAEPFKQWLAKVGHKAAHEDMALCEK